MVNPTSREIWLKPLTCLGTIYGTVQVTSGNQLEFDIWSNEVVISCPLGAEPVISIAGACTASLAPQREQDLPAGITFTDFPGTSWEARGTGNLHFLCRCICQRWRRPRPNYNHSAQYPYRWWCNSGPASFCQITWWRSSSTCQSYSTRECLPLARAVTHWFLVYGIPKWIHLELAPIQATEPDRPPLPCSVRLNMGKHSNPYKPRTSLILPSNAHNCTKFSFSSIVLSSKCENMARKSRGECEIIIISQGLQIRQI